MKIAAILCLMVMAFALGDALRCYSCSWTRGALSLNDDKRCADHGNLPEEFLIDCSESDSGNESCSLLEIQDEKMKTTSVERGCSRFVTSDSICREWSGNSGICNCNWNGCNYGKLLD